MMIKYLILFALISTAVCYDPEDEEIQEIIPPEGKFEPFYPRGAPKGTARAPHGHGTFFAHRNPALIEVKNAAAYGFRFDGERRFNYDK